VGALNIGYSPTFEKGEEIRAEVYLDGFEGDLYGEMMIVLFLATYPGRKEIRISTGTHRANER